MTAKQIDWDAHRPRIVLIISMVLTAVLYIVPLLGLFAYPFMLLSTLAHELGHGLTALLLGGSFHRFVMSLDGSGVAQFSGITSRLGLATVAAGGLVGPAVAATVGFAAGRTLRGARICLLSVAGLLAVTEIFVVRGFFAFFFVAVVIAGCALVALKASEEIGQLVLVFLAVQLALSVFSRSDYLFTPAARTAQGIMPSDVSQMAEALFLPYWFWGAACGALSVAVLAFGLKIFWRR